MDTAVESSVNNSGDCNGESNNGKVQRKVGLVYDETMCKHDTPDGEAHPERPDRIRVIWEKLQLSGVTQRFILYSSPDLFWVAKMEKLAAETLVKFGGFLEMGLTLLLLKTFLLL